MPPCDSVGLLPLPGEGTAPESQHPGHRMQAPGGTLRLFGSPPASLQEGRGSRELIGLAPNRIVNSYGAGISFHIFGIWLRALRHDNQSCRDSPEFPPELRMRLLSMFVFPQFVKCNPFRPSLNFTVIETYMYLTSRVKQLCRAL